MNLKNVEKKEKNTAVLTIEIDAKEFDAAVNKVYRQAKNSINVPGFRKGKAPRKLIEKMYGANVFYEDAINDLYPDALEAAITEADLNVVGYPETKLEHAGPDGLLFTVTVGVKPEVKLGQYKGIECPKETVEVTDEDVENELRPLIARATTQDTVERAAEMTDTAVIDFEGFKDGVAFDGGKGENYELKLGSHTFIPGFEEQIVGMAAGEEKEINVTFPEDYGAEDLAGAAVVFKVKVNSVKADSTPVIDDEFAKDVSEFETLDELKADLRAKVEKRKTDAAQSSFEVSVMNKVIENAELDVPDTMVEYELDKQIQNFQNQVQAYGMTMDQYLGMMGTNIQEFRDNQRAGCLNNIKNDLVLEAVVNAEGIEASEEEIEAEIQKLAQQYDREVDDIREMVTTEQVAFGVKMQKAGDLIVAEAVVVEA